MAMALTYYERNRERLLARAKLRAQAKREEIREYKRAWWAANRDSQCAKKRARYVENRAEVLAAQKADYHANPQTKRERSKAYRRANPGKASAAVTAWVERNRERWRAMKRAYAKKRPELGRAKTARRRARLADAFVESVDFTSVLAESGGVCGICAKPLGDDVHFDHIVPLARGGKHERANIQAAHPSCNTRKGARLPAEISAWL